MKKLRFYFVLLLSVSLMASCTKNDPVGPPNNNNNNNTNNNNNNNNNNNTGAAFTYTIAGHTYSTNSCGAEIENGQITVASRTDAGDVLGFSISDTTTGNYTVGQTSQDAILFTPAGGQASSTNGGSGGQGVITITSKVESSKTMSGTFSGTLINPANGAKTVVTNGRFTNVRFTRSTATVNKNLTAKVDGNDWKAESVTALKSNGQIVISASKNDGTSIGFTFDVTKAPGTYPIDMSNGITAFYNVSSTSKYFMGKSGSMVISENDATSKTIKATFDFVGEDMMNPSDTVNVTNGAFTVSYK